MKKLNSEQSKSVYSMFCEYDKLSGENMAVESFSKWNFTRMHTIVVCTGAQTNSNESTDQSATRIWVSTLDLSCASCPDGERGKVDDGGGAGPTVFGARCRILRGPIYVYLSVVYIGFHFGGGRLCIWFLGGREGGSTLLRKKLL
jgi:hypothetical protein